MNAGSIALLFFELIKRLGLRRTSIRYSTSDSFSCIYTARAAQHKAPVDPGLAQKIDILGSPKKSGKGNRPADQPANPNICTKAEQYRH